MPQKKFETVGGILNTQCAVNQGAALPADPGLAVNKAHAHAAISLQLGALAHQVALRGSVAVGEAVGLQQARQAGVGAARYRIFDQGAAFHHKCAHFVICRFGRRTGAINHYAIHITGGLQPFDHGLIRHHRQARLRIRQAHHQPADAHVDNNRQGIGFNHRRL